jgi:DNA repair protein RadC
MASQLPSPPNQGELQAPFTILTLKTLNIMEKISEKWTENACFCEVKLSYMPTVDVQSQPSIDCPEKAVFLLRTIWDMDTIELYEDFCMLLLNNSKVCLGWSTISSGGKRATIVDVSKVATTALLGNASSVIICHNHPSGTLNPSTADIHLTKRIKEALDLLGMSLTDHIILTRNKYYSFKNEGKLFDSGPS